MYTISYKDLVLLWNLRQNPTWGMMQSCGFSKVLNHLCTKEQIPLLFYSLAKALYHIMMSLWPSWWCHQVCPPISPPWVHTGIHTHGKNGPTLWTHVPLCGPQIGPTPSAVCVEICFGASPAQNLNHQGIAVCMVGRALVCPIQV